MPVVSVVLAGLMMRSRGAIRLGMRIACRRTPTAIGFGGYSLWTPDSRECGYSVRIQCVRLHDRAIRTRGSPGSDKLESVCTGCQTHTHTHTHLRETHSHTHTHTYGMRTHTHTPTHTCPHTHTHTHTARTCMDCSMY